VSAVIEATPLNVCLSLVVTYVLGALPFAVWIGRLKGVDPRKRGSKNPGASNVARTIGVKWGLLTLFFDGLKGFVAVTLIFRFTAHDPEAWLSRELWGALTGLMAVLGHCSSPFLGFKGGRGVATTGGGLLALHPGLGLLCSLGWLLALMVTQRPAWASLILCAVMLLLSQAQGVSEATQLFAILSAVVIVLRHWTHLVKLLSGRSRRG